MRNLKTLTQQIIVEKGDPIVGSNFGEMKASEYLEKHITDDRSDNLEAVLLNDDSVCFRLGATEGGPKFSGAVFTLRG